MTHSSVAAQLAAWVDAQPRPLAHCYVGLSGGMDSTVLLHGMVQLRERYRARDAEFAVSALHLNHGLQADADRWQQHCAALCQSLAVPLVAQTLAPGQLRAAGGSLEAAARAARYDFFATQLPAGALLLLAHHADDQAETVLLRLVQGRGLLPMPQTRPLAQAALWRPLLSLPRAALTAYASEHDLQWLEDPSNADEQMDRNFLRQRVLPELQARWPGLAANLRRVADTAAGQNAALDAVLAGQLRLPIALCQSPEGASIVRSWLGQFSEYEVTDRAIREFVRQLGSNSDRKPQLTLARGTLVRVKNEVCYQPAD